MTAPKHAAPISSPAKNSVGPRSHDATYFTPALCERHGASRRFLWDNVASRLPVASAIPLKLSGISRTPRRAGFTVIELLVAMVITLIMMGAVATLFGTITGGVQDARATIEMTERLRSATSRLQQDLQGVTATMHAPRQPESDEGYFELIEGLQSDRLIDDPSNSDPNVMLDPTTAPFLSRFGDLDDVLMFTTRTRGEPFIGKMSTSLLNPDGTQTFPNGTGQSQVAEVVYFLRPSPTSTAINPQFTLYRRCLLVLLPYAGTAGTIIADARSPALFRDNYDLSARPTANGYVANTLGDLTKRENRFAHNLANGTFQFPYAVNFPVDPLDPADPYPAAAIQEFPFGSPRYGEDVILSNVLSFDVQVWDPGCPLKTDGSGIILTPRDPGYNAPGATVTTPATFGAFVDLGYFPSNLNNNASYPQMTFNNPPGGTPATTDRSGLRAAYANPTRYTYDTYSTHYENNWVDVDNSGNVNAGDSGDEFGDGKADLGINGFDDPDPVTGVADGVVDDPGEAETAPPYAAPLRGIRITIRVYEPDSRQVREVNIEQDFVPE